MRTVICTAGSGPAGELLEVSLPVMADYADRHGFDLRATEKDLAEGRPGAWGKIRMIQSLLDDHEVVVWLDADALIVDPSRNIAEELRPGKDLYLVAHLDTRQATCLSNQKQIGLAFLQYVQDYDEKFPCSTDAWSIINPGAQFTAASDGIEDWSWEAYDTGPNGEERMTWDVLISPYVKNYDVYHCPDDGQHGTKVIGYNGAQVERSYSVANGIIDYQHSSRGASLAQIPNPAATVMTDERSWCPLGGQADAANDNDWWWASCQDTETPDELGYTGTAGNGVWPHNNYIAMFAYADGHVHPVVWQGAGKTNASIGSNLFPGYPITSNSTTGGPVPDFNDYQQPFPLQ